MLTLDNNPEIKGLAASAQNGFVPLPGKSYRARNTLIAAPLSQDAKSNPDDIPNTHASYIAAERNAKNAAYDPAEERRLLMLLAEAPYRGLSVEYHVRRFNKDLFMEEEIIQSLSSLKGWNACPDRHLEILVGGRTVGLIDPVLACPVPGPGVDLQAVAGEREIGSYISADEKVRKRYRALLSAMYKGGTERELVTKIGLDSEDLMKDDELREYYAEPAPVLKDEEWFYFRTVFGPERSTAVLGHPGRNFDDILLDEITCVAVGTGSVLGIPENRETSLLTNTKVIIDPFRSFDKGSSAVYHAGPCMQGEDPEYVEVYARTTEGTSSRRIYHRPDEGWRVARPNVLVDLFHRVPEGIFGLFNYAFFESSVELDRNANEVEASWVLCPDSPKIQTQKLHTVQNPASWNIHQRKTRVSGLQLTGTDGRVMGYLTPDGPVEYKKSGATVGVAVDAAGDVSVRMISRMGSDRTEPLSYERLVWPITPCSESEWKNIVEFNVPSPDGAQRHFRSLVQFFEASGGNVNPLYTCRRRFQPSMDVLFDNLQMKSSTMESSMMELGIISNPKQMLSRSLDDATFENTMEALKIYIGSMVLEAILSLSREGYRPADRNIRFMLSYPENTAADAGAEAGQIGMTRYIKEAIQGAVEYVNGYMNEENQLYIDGKDPTAVSDRVNVWLYSESEAVAGWSINKKNTGNQYLADTMAVLTVDYGHSTFDVSLKVNGRMYCVSIPYAAYNITICSLAEVYRGNSGKMLRCFNDCDENIMNKAGAAIRQAMEEETDGDVQDRIGFNLSLSYLFSHGSFRFNKVNNDPLQKRFMKTVECRLNVTIPVIAKIIARAVQNGDLGANQAIYWLPVGKGSRAMDNTEEGFFSRFGSRTRACISRTYGVEFAGDFRKLQNYDSEKLSVAEGMIELCRRPAARPWQVVRDINAVEHYMDVVFKDKEERSAFRKKIEANSDRSKIKELDDLLSELQNDAFDAFIRNYTIENFLQDFATWGYIGISESTRNKATFDSLIKEYVTANFDEVLASASQQRRALIMSCPGCESQMIFGAMLDFACAAV